MASTRDWFETVAEAQRRARRRLPRSVYLAVLAGAEAGVTMNDNVRAFSELWFRPHVAGLPAARELATTIMGHEISLPVLISPTGVQAVHPDGEVAVARAAAGAGTAMGLSSFASKPVEEVGRATDKLLFQCYWAGSRDDILARARRARAAGATGLIVTLDWVFDSRRDWGSAWIFRPCCGMPRRSRSGRSTWRGGSAAGPCPTWGCRTPRLATRRSPASSKP